MRLENYGHCRGQWWSYWDRDRERERERERDRAISTKPKDGAVKPRGRSSRSRSRDRENVRRQASNSSPPRGGISTGAGSNGRRSSRSPTATRHPSSRSRSPRRSGASGVGSDRISRHSQSRSPLRRTNSNTKTQTSDRTRSKSPRAPFTFTQAANNPEVLKLPDEQQVYCVWYLRRGTCTHSELEMLYHPPSLPMKLRRRFERACLFHQQRKGCTREDCAFEHDTPYRQLELETE
jgi:hypothetical protein